MLTEKELLVNHRLLSDLTITIPKGYLNQSGSSPNVSSCDLNVIIMLIKLINVDNSITVIVSTKSRSTPHQSLPSKAHQQQDDQKSKKAKASEDFHEGNTLKEIWGGDINNSNGPMKCFATGDNKPVINTMQKLRIITQ